MFLFYFLGFAGSMDIMTFCCARKYYLATTSFLRADL